MDRIDVTAAAVAAKQETNLALGAIQVDFTLIKIQPPREYRGLGESLSKTRKIEAEDLRIHGLASKLGVLFDSVVPSVPNLISAYGTRCSEIAKSPVHNPQGSHKHGLFKDQIGADGTSIWAAATSSTAAIAIHLLACMLARIWDGPKAVSIWMELIAMRKDALAKSGKPIDYHASRIEISRDEISSWDASARAWRLTADSADERRQKQLLLIVDHLGLPVNAKLDLNESVIEAWKTAMITVDKLVAGVPQVVHVAAPLLGLAAWHLYPDMLVLGRGRGGCKEVKQKDPLIKRGGLLTLGLEDSRRHGEGIYWSLPLAHLRYYGDPVLSKAQLGTETSRRTIRQLFYIALGSLIRRWCSDQDDIDRCARLIVKLQSYVHAEHSSWLHFLADGARHYLNCQDTGKEEMLQLIKLGRRRFATFIDDLTTKPIFGLSDCRTFLRLLPTNSARISLLRQVSKDFGDSCGLMLIQCAPEYEVQGWDLASAHPLAHWADPMRSQNVYWTQNAQHLQELEGLYAEYGGSIDPKYASAPSMVIQMSHFEHIPGFHPFPGFAWQNVPKKVYEMLCFTYVPNDDWRYAETVVLTPRLVFGDPNLAALYSVSITFWNRGANLDAQMYCSKNVRELPNILMLKHVLAAIEQQLPSQNLLSHYLRLNPTPTFYDFQAPVAIDSAHVLPIRALMTVWQLYSQLSNASLEASTASKPLSTHAWIPGTSGNGAFDLTFEQMLACIARFESGSFNVSPSAMQAVFAIACGNSLYVAKRLLQDPNTVVQYPYIERLVGNIGQSGMALLVTPQSLKVRKLSDDFRLVNHFKYDGQNSDCFESTTLHLSFTDWRMPLDVGAKGIRDIEAFYIEAPIKVHDHKGDFVADVNILDVFKHAKSRIISPCQVRHEQGQPLEIVEKLNGAVAIDSWEELLDSPPEVGVVRAFSNWQARLATAALALRQGHEVRILDSHACWTCASDLPPVKTTEEVGDQDSDDEDDMITAPSSVHYESESDSDVDIELERESQRRRKRMKLDDGSYVDGTETPPKYIHRNTMYIC